MLDVSEVDPFVACTKFAVEWLGHVASHDLTRAESMIDVVESGIPFAQSFPAPDGFTYCQPSRAEGWDLHFLALSQGGLSVDFEVPFLEKNFRPMMANFTMRRKGNFLEVRFGGLDIT